MLYHIAVGINQVKLHATELCTLTTVCTAGEAML